jgi:hypothetical protein
MRARNWLVMFFIAIVLVAPVAYMQERGMQEEYGPYDPVANWPKPLLDGKDGVTHTGWTWGSVGSVYAETPERVWVAMRGELPLPEGAKPWTPYGMITGPKAPGNATGNEDGVSATCEKTTNLRGWQRRMHHVIFVVNSAGDMVDWWQQHDALFEAPCGRGPHKIKISPYDPAKHVWVIDDQLHQIHKFTYDGKLVMSLGTKGLRGRDAGKAFDRPTDIAWFPDGTFFISDGYGGKRVAKFDPNGKFLMEWGSAPKDPAKPGPNEWNTVHSIAVSNDRRVFVVDRGHRRVQVFDENGKFLDMWTTGVQSSPYSHLITANQEIVMTDGGTHRVIKYDLKGNYIYGWGSQGPQLGRFNGPHASTVDQKGNFYTAEVFGGRVAKFAPKPGADPRKLAGQEVRPKS